MRRDRSDFWEGIKAHNATVTCAIFTPHPETIIKPEIDDDDISSVNVSTPTSAINIQFKHFNTHEEKPFTNHIFLVFFFSFLPQSSSIAQDPMVEQRKKGCGYVLISADFNGAIKVFVNKTKPKHSSLPYTAILD